LTRLLDTNICIAYLNGTDPSIRQRLLACIPEEMCLCSVVKAELFFGARNSKHIDSNLQRVQSFFDMFESYPFDDGAAEHYGLIRTQLQREGNPIGANDLMIASIALHNNLILVSRNQREFGRITGLRLEVW